MTEYHIGFWNVENLFSPENHPARIDWVASQVASDLAGWSETLFNRKLAQLSKVITAMNGGTGPDILGVCEVEDKPTLEALVAVLNQNLPTRNYQTVFATEDLSFRGIDTAFIFDGNAFSVDENLVFNHFVMRRTGTRDILQATFKAIDTGSEIVVLANHWPSRSGSTPSAGFRATAGETLAYWHTRILELASAGDRTPVIAMGDMNDDPWDPSLTIHAVATRERGDVERAHSAKFWNASWQYLEANTTDHRGDPRKLEGTLYFSGDGNLFDQTLIGKALLDDKASDFKLVDGTASMFLLPEMVSHKVGSGPIRFGLPKGNVTKNIDENGFSDHVPIEVRVLDTKALVA